MWITFFLFGMSMVVFAFFLTCFVRQSRVAVLLGIFIFVIGLLFESFVFSSGFLGYLWWNDTIISLGAYQGGFLVFIVFFYCRVFFIRWIRKLFY